MTLDVGLRAVASQLVNQFGKAVIYRRNLRTDYDPATGVSAVDDFDDREVVVVLQPTGSSIKPTVGFMEATTIEDGDMLALLAASDIEFTPSAGDHLVIDEVTWNIVAIIFSYSGEQVALYELQVRR